MVIFSGANAHMVTCVGLCQLWLLLYTEQCLCRTTTVDHGVRVVYKYESQVPPAHAMLLAEWLLCCTRHAAVFVDSCTTEHCRVTDLQRSTLAAYTACRQITQMSHYSMTSRSQLARPCVVDLADLSVARRMRLLSGSSIAWLLVL